MNGIDHIPVMLCMCLHCQKANDASQPAANSQILLFMREIFAGRH